MPLVNFTWKYVPPSPQRTCKTFVLEYVSKVFSEKELRSLKRQKARGIDNLPSALLKDCGRYISAPLCSIINLSIETSTVPTIWKSARVMPIFKSRDPSLLTNYRPISILPVLSKILEKAVHKNLSDFESLDRRAKAILPIGTLPSIYNQLKQECVVLVKKCLNSELGCEIFNTYFDITAHTMNKRNNFSSIKLPPVKLEVARRGFYFAGGTLYNSLTLYIRDITNTLDLKKSVSTFFSADFLP